MHQLLENIPYCLSRLDADGRYAFACQETSRLFGVPAEQLIGKRPSEVGDKKNAKKYSAFEKMVEQTFADGISRKAEQQWMIADGTRIFEITSVPERDEQGRIVSVLSIFHDITERKLVENELRDSEARFRVFADHALDAFFLHGENGEVLDVNHQACLSLGYTRDELIGMNPGQFDADLSQEYRDSMRARVHKGEIVAFESHHRRKDGSVFPVEVYLRPFLGGDGRLMISLARDISHRKQSESALRSLNRELTAISSCTQVLMRATDEQGLFDEICKTICDTAGYRMAWVGLAEHDAAKTVRAVAQYGFETDYLENIGITWADNERGQGPVGTAIRTGITQINQDFLSNPLMAPWRDAALKSGFRSNIALPLKNGADTMGCLSIYSEEPDSFAAEEVKLLEALAEDLSFGIGILKTRHEHQQAEVALRESEERYRTIFENSPLGIFRSTIEGRFLELNPAMARMLGYDSPAQAMQEIVDIGKQIYVHAEDRRKIVSRQLDAGDGAMQHLSHYRRRDGSEWVASLYLESIRDAKGRHVFFDGIVEDVTERIQSERERDNLQAQLTQAQKMESVGRLAGGIAHDFNNILSAIIGYTELAMQDLQADDRIFGYLQEVHNAADRSGDLVRQLLAFARKQTVLPKLIDLNETVAGMIGLLQGMIGKGIQLAWQPGDDLWQLKMDPTQIDQILTNLCVNARDAITGSGEVTIDTGNAVLDKEYAAKHPGAIPGDYVLLRVRDNGHGMVQETLDHVFEPFFTTKDIGEGTGLGLATVYGIVKQNKGFIDIASEPGHGTTASVYLPRHVAESAQPADSTPAEMMEEDQETTVLVVEDEPVILDIARMILEQNGYRVLTASLPDQALRLAEEHAGSIHLLITDVTMPGMNGRELADRLLSLYPDMLCLFMSGYSGDVIASHGVLTEDIHFIQKPFSMSGLADRVRLVLDEG